MPTSAIAHTLTMGTASGGEGTPGWPAPPPPPPPPLFFFFFFFKNGGHMTWKWNLGPSSLSWRAAGRRGTKEAVAGKT